MFKLDNIDKIVIRNYIDIRSNNVRHTFNKYEIDLINKSFIKNNPIYNKQAYFINPNKNIDKEFENKKSDDFIILLFNLIFNENITSIDEIKSTSSAIINDLDNKYPLGHNMSETELIRYITAHSSSSFLGIQSQYKSNFALKSLQNTIKAHASYNFVDKPWLIDNLEFIKQHITLRNIMDKRYGDICLSSKNSSSSILGDSRNFRDYVFEHTFDDIINNISGPECPPYIITAALRLSRRAKARLVCSFNANIRIIDFLINNGSYALCERDGILSNYTTEGLSGLNLWTQLALMSKRELHKTMICLDFRGYDSQISLKEYMEISRFLNEYRLNSDEKFKFIFEYFEDWILQPKMLVSQGLSGYEILIPLYKTLASGLHGTHSFENLIGISYSRQLSKLGIPVYMFKANGDDQNIMINNSDVDSLLSFTSEYFDIEPSKSLIGHDLTVWGKKWFTRAMYPVVEIGTIRSLWEKEGGNIDNIEPSKLESNYCKIINLIIFLHRLGIEEHIIRNIMIYLCCEVGIRHEIIPVSLNNIQQIKSGKIIKNNLPVGLESDRSYLSSITLDKNIVGSLNVYDMLNKVYKERIFFQNSISELQYHPDNSKFYIEANQDYSLDKEINIPWMFRGIEISRLNTNQLFVRSVLQGTGSYDGAVGKEFEFFDMYSLSLAIHYRNQFVWKSIQSRL